MSAVPEHSVERGGRPPLVLVTDGEMQAPGLGAELAERFNKAGHGLIEAYDQEVGRLIESNDSYSFNQQLWKAYGRIATESLAIGKLLAHSKEPVNSDGPEYKVRQRPKGKRGLSDVTFPARLASLLEDNADRQLTTKEIAEMLDPDDPDQLINRIGTAFYDGHVQIRLAKKGLALHRLVARPRGYGHNTTFVRILKEGEVPQWDFPEKFWNGDMPETPAKRYGLKAEWLREMFKTFVGRPLAVEDLAKVLYAEEFDTVPTYKLQGRVTQLLWKFDKRELVRSGLKVKKISLPEPGCASWIRFISVNSNEEIDQASLDNNLRPSDDELRSLAAELRLRELSGKDRRIHEEVETTWQRRESEHQRLLARQTKNVERGLDNLDRSEQKDKRNLERFAKLEIAFGKALLQKWGEQEEADLVELRILTKPPADRDPTSTSQTFTVQLAEVLKAHEGERLSVKELAQLIDPNNTRQAAGRIYNIFYDQRGLAQVLAADGFILDKSKVPRPKANSGSVYTVLRVQQSELTKTPEQDPNLKDYQPQGTSELPEILITREGTFRFPGRYKFMWEDDLAEITDDALRRLAKAAGSYLGLKYVRVPVEQGHILQTMVKQGMITPEQAEQGELDVSQAVKAMLLGTADGRRLMLGGETKKGALRCIDERVEGALKNAMLKDAHRNP